MKRGLTSCWSTPSADFFAEPHIDGLLGYAKVFHEAGVKHTCIGCRYCMMACPYEARSFIHEPAVNQKSHAPRGKGTVESCTLCVHRVDKGGVPACVEACEATGHWAIIFGDLKDPESEIAKRLRTMGKAASIGAAETMANDIWQARDRGFLTAHA